MCMWKWKKRTRVGWTRSERSSNHHRLVRVLKHPDSSVIRSGRQDKQPDGLLTADVVSNLGKHNSPTTKRVDTRAVRTTANITFLQQDHKPKDKEKGSEETKQFDPGEEGG